MGKKARRSDFSKKRKFAGNRFTKSDVKNETPTEDEVLHTASSKKLNNIPNVEKPTDCNGQVFFMDLECLNVLFSTVHCPACSTSNLSVSDDPAKRMGCSLELYFTCAACGYVSERQHSSKRCDKVFEVNRRLVYGMRQIGCGFEEACTFLSTMNMPPPPNKSAYNAHNKSLLQVVERLGEEIMMGSAIRVRQTIGSDECGVSVDGSWHRRGYSSLNGVVTTLSIDTGEALDVEILSKECFGCRKWGSIDKADPRHASMIANHQCRINYTGSSGGMEPVGAGRIFLRSEAKRGLKYVDFYGDGDSKSYATVKDLDPYNGTPINKKECIGHYQKRLGTALRKLKSKNKGLGGRGKLTNNLVNKMQNYFGIALRNNTESVEKMSKAIWSSFYHLCAKDTHPLHTKCPIGSDSWCSFQRAKAKNIPYKHKGGLPLNVMQLVKPIYQRLTDEDMLAKCLHGKTQNCNESLHSLIWKRCPKTTYAGPDVVKLAVYDAIIYFNSGAEPQLEVLKRMNMVPGQYMVQGVQRKDTLRIKSSQQKSTPMAKKRRKYLRGQKKQQQDSTSRVEGPTYAAGGFD